MGKLTLTPEVLAQLAERFRVLAATAVRGRALLPTVAARSPVLETLTPYPVSTDRLERWIVPPLAEPPESSWTDLV